MSPATTTVARKRRRRAPYPTVREGLNGQANSFGLIRLVLAVAVIWSHAFPLGGWGEDPALGWTGGQESLGGIAVLGFFAVSGYLITRSGMRGHVIPFVWARFLRILPAFWVVLVIGALVVGPIGWAVAGGSVTSYLSISPDGPWSYLLGNWSLTIRQWGIGGVFEDTPYGATVNGSLWTLEHEWFCYLAVAALMVIGVLRRPAVAQVVVPLATAFLLALQAVVVGLGVSLAGVVPLVGTSPRTRVVCIFLLGACLAVFADRVRLDPRLAAASAVVLLLACRTRGLDVVGLVAIAYLVLWLAARLPRRLQAVGRTNDYSYGVYLYAFPVQQLLAAVGVPRWGFLPYVATTLLVVAICAWLSWHLVEKRALSFKDRGPGRGWQHWRRLVARRRERVRPAAVGTTR